MKLLTAPTTSALYPDLAAESVMAVRMKLGMSRISLNYRRLPGNIGERSEFCVTVKLLQRNHVIQSLVKIDG